MKKVDTPSGTPSVWRAPRLSWRFWPVFLRNLLVWRKLAIPSLVGNIAEPLMWLVAFGYGMGALVGDVALDAGGPRVPYILFLASGSICMSAMNAASFEALYSAFSRMHVQKTWDGILNAPVRLDDVVLAEMLWAAFKSLFTVTAILGVMLGLGISHAPMLLLAWPALLLVGITFSCVALIFNALAKGYDFFTYYFTLFLTPMMMGLSEEAQKSLGAQVPFRCTEITASKSSSVMFQIMRSRSMPAELTTKSILGP